MTKRQIIEFLRTKAEDACRLSCLAEYECATLISQHPKEHHMRIYADRDEARHYAHNLENIYYGALGRPVHTKGDKMFPRRKWKKMVEFMHRTVEISKEVDAEVQKEMSNTKVADEAK